MRLKSIARAIALLGAAAPVLAQTTTNTLERVEITGSSIKRVQTEGATPVQTITRTEIERAGIVNAEQLLMRISANGTGADNLSSNVGIQLGTTDRNNNGNSSANLRGLGSSSTLVLLNGRRIAAHGAKGNSVDLNWIPIGAVERVEVLKDGASAIYGTDAVGGVINFILRKDYAGFEATGFVDVTEAGGGNVYSGSLLGGWGNLQTDRYNFMASLTFDRQQKLGGNERSFSNGFQPERGLSPDTAGTPFATQQGLAGSALGATYTLPTTGSQTYNRANLLSFQGACDTFPGMSQYQSALWGAPGARFACAYDYGASAMLIQPLERTNFVGRGSIAINPDTTAFVEAVVGRSIAKKQFEPYQITTTIAAGNAYPVGGPYYQDLSAYIPSFNPNLPISYRWRCVDCGGRTIETTTDAYRVLAGLEGTLAGKWDYRLGVSTAESKAQSILGEGYMFTNALNAALGSGVVNPWVPLGQSQPAAGMAALRAASAAGTRLFDGKSSTTEIDGVISGELAQLPAGPLSAAVGFDYRKESYAFSDGSVTTNPVFLAPFDPEFPKVSRDIKAVFAELAVPVVKGLEATLAVRHDEYSDFGGTTNPKVALKYMPVKQVLVRGSYNTGFRAPSFFQLYTQQALAQIPGNIADPLLCPGGSVPGSDLTVCAIRPNGLTGGNPDLKPEESKQWTVGIVLSPTDWFTAAIDVWEIKRTNLIYQLTPQQIIANYPQFGEAYIQRGTDNRIDGPGGFIRAGFVNADGDITRGTDLSLQATMNLGGGRLTGTLDGTYIDSHRTRIFSSQPYVETAGQWNSRDLFVRWKHQLGVTYTRGPWSGTIAQGYTSGYKDERPAGTVPAGWNPKVDSYTVYHLSASYTGIKNLTLTAGIKNLFDKDPPFTAHNLDFAAGAGWDPRVADPRGRAYTLRLNYRFF